MRLYSFTNMYTVGIHAGIQTAHLVHKGLFSKYENQKLHEISNSKEKYNKLKDWSENHQTIIILNGGYHSNILKIHEKLRKFSDIFELPFGIFFESEEALNGAATATGIIIPEEIYDYDHEDDTDCQENYLRTGEQCLAETEEYKFYKFLKSFPLAT